MASYEIEFGKLGETYPVPPLTVRTTDPNVLHRTVEDHARPHITSTLAQMGRPELADCLFRTNTSCTLGELLHLDLAAGKATRFLGAKITVTPERVQRKRTKGSVLGAARYVGRGTRWGNPFTIAQSGTQHVVTNPEGNVLLARNSPAAARKAAADWYHAWLVGPSQEALLDSARQELAGRDLACWCPLPADGETDHCHARVLLELANGGES